MKELQLHNEWSSPPNEIQQGNGFYISYNNQDVQDSMFGCITTALVTDQMDRFYILNGDHRVDYRLIIALGYNECLNYYNLNKGLHNKRTDTDASLASLKRIIK
jgi:hypothetical protein